jgi:hypothetical protein
MVLLLLQRADERGAFLFVFKDLKSDFCAFVIEHPRQ